MNVKVEKIDNKQIAILLGRIDTSTAEQVQNALLPLTEMENPEIEIDCTNLDYTSSQGLRIFLQMQKTVSLKKGHLVLTNMQPNVREVFDISGFSKIIEIR